MKPVLYIGCLLGSVHIYINNFAGGSRSWWVAENVIPILFNPLLHDCFITPCLWSKDDFKCESSSFCTLVKTLHGISQQCCWSLLKCLSFSSKRYSITSTKTSKYSMTSSSGYFSFTSSLALELKHQHFTRSSSVHISSVKFLSHDWKLYFFISACLF